MALALAPAARADMKALEEAARKEGELTWYTSHHTSEGAEDLGRGFTEMYGIKANVVRMTAQVAYQRVLQDLKKNLVPCDVFSSTDVGHYVRLAAAGRLEKYSPQTESKISPVFRNFDSNGYYHTTSAGLVVLTYNSAKVKSRGRAQEMDGSSGHQMEGQGLRRPPGLFRLCRHLGAGDQEPLWLVVLRQAREEQAADGPFDKRHGDGLERRERQVAAGCRRPDLVQCSRGNPLAVNYPSDGAVLIIAPSAIVKGARHPNAARLFMEYLYSIEASKINARHFGIPLQAGSALATGSQADQRDQDHPADRRGNRQRHPRGDRAVARDVRKLSHCRPSEQLPLQ